jgi:hypothetical protein
VSGLPTLSAHGISGQLPVARAAKGGARPDVACNDRIVSGWHAVSNTGSSARRKGSERSTTQVRSFSRVRSGIAGLVPVVALASLVGVAASIAHADAVDEKFLAALKAKGINFESPQKALIAGHMVCDQLDLGRQPSDVANDVTKNSNLGGYHAGFFVGVSIAAFCPRHAQ